MTGYDAIVIGAGAHGAAAAWRLARAGRRVLLLERQGLLHALGSSHGESRIIRLTYGHAAYVALAREAYAGWEDLERETGEVLLHRTGDLFFGPEGGPIAGYATALEAAGVPFERLAPAEAERRFPAFRLDPGMVALYQAEGGVLPATRCVAALLAAARAAGADIYERTFVQNLAVGDSRLQLPEDSERTFVRNSEGCQPLVVRTDRGSFRAGRVIVAAGAWTPQLVPELRLPLRVTRQVVATFRPPGEAATFRPDRMPVFVSLGGAGGGDEPKHYGIPIFGRFGVKVARHGTHAPAVDPDAVDRAVGAHELDDVRAFLARHIPGLARAEAVDAHVCLYAMTPDEHFVIDRHPRDPRIVVCSACSGHGFKFAPAIGRILADLAFEGTSGVRAFEENRAKFSIGRFGS